MHMALDEVLLEQLIRGRRGPTMRLWRWIERALVIGSHQSVRNEIDVAAAKELDFVVTRRMSGPGSCVGASSAGCFDQPFGLRGTHSRSLLA